MIASLKGRLTLRSPPFLVVEVNGIGYELEAPLSVFDTLPETGGAVELLTHLVVREDAHTLYGFAQEADRRLFRELLKVSGIGPRLALAILSGVSGDDFALMIESGDTLALTRLPGIGRKTAERIVLEMRGRLEGLATGAAGAGGEAADPPAEARAALVALGYSPAEALRLVRELATSGLAAEEIIRQALRKRMEG